MKLKRILLVLIIISFTAMSIPLFATPTDDQIKQKQAELKALQQKIELTKSSILKMKSQKNVVAKKVEALNKELNDALAALEKVENQLSALENQITKTKVELDRSVKEAGAQKELLKKRVKAMYENGTIGYLSVALSATSFSDFISRVDFLKRIIDFDMNLLKKMREYSASVEAQKNKLQKEQEEKAALQADINAQKQSVEQTKKDQEAALKDINKDLKELEKMEDALNDQANQASKMILALQSKNKYVGGKFEWPAPDHYTITSPFGYRIHPILKKRKFHSGIDISAPSGTKVVAANAGKVIYAGYYGSYGYAVIIDHGGKITTLYAHNSKLLVSEGDTVKKGEQIAKSGSTGLSTGPHIHFEVRENGQYVDPMKYLTSK